MVNSIARNRLVRYLDEESGNSAYFHTKYAEYRIIVNIGQKGII